MSKTFGPSFKNVVPSAGLLLEDTNRFNKATNNDFSRNTMSEGVIRSNMSRAIGRTNSTFNSRLLSQGYTETFTRCGQLNNEFSKDFNSDMNVIKDYNKPSTSRELESSSRSGYTDQDRYSRDLTAMHARPSYVRNFGTRSGTLSTGLLPYRNKLKDRDSNLSHSHSTISETFAPRSGTLTTGILPHSTTLRRQDSNINSSYAATSFSQKSTMFVKESVLCDDPDVNLNLTNRVNQINRIEPITTSRTAGLISGRIEPFIQENQKFNEETLNDGIFNRPTTTRILKSKNSTISNKMFVNNSRQFNQNPDFKINNSNNISAMSNIIGPRHSTISTRMFGNESGRFNQNPDFRSNIDNNISNISNIFGPRHSTFNRNLLLHDDIKSNITNSEGVNEEMNFASMTRTVGPTVRQSTLNSELSIHDNLRYNNESSYSISCRPTISQVLRSKNSKNTTKFFPRQNIDQRSKDFSNVNGFNVTHISRKGMESLSESRFPVTLKNNRLDNISVAGSFLSASIASAKAQFINVLENLHHTILNIAQDLPVEPIRVAFDKAKEGLDNINEITFAPTSTIREIDEASIISHSSKQIYPTLTCEATESIPDNFISLKSGKEILESLTTSTRSRTSAILSKAEEEKVSLLVKASQGFQVLDESKDSALTFKKPKPFSKSKRKSLKSLKIKTPQVAKSMKRKNTAKSSTSTGKICKSPIKTSKSPVKPSKTGINLKCWYPIAFGEDLAFGGIIDNGTSIQTEPVRKRITNKKVELKNGLECNLVGSPSHCILSCFPKTVIAKLKNGLTSQWKIFQKEVLVYQNLITEQENCKKLRVNGNKDSHEICTSTPRTRKQAVMEKLKETTQEKCISSTPIRRRSLRKTNLNIIAEEKVSPIKTQTVRKTHKTKRKSIDSKKVKSSPVNKWKESTKKKKNPKEKTSDDYKEQHTRSGRTVKPPGLYWMGCGSNTVTSSGVTETPEEINTKKVSTKKKSNTHKKAKESISEKLNLDDSERKKVAKVQSSTEDAELQIKNQRIVVKRKREVACDAGDPDSTQRKKSKSAKTEKATINSAIKDDEESTIIISKENDNRLTRSRTQSGKRVALSPKRVKEVKEDKKKVFNIKKKTTKVVTAKETVQESFCTDFENYDCDFKLDDIDVPDLGNVSCRSHLSRSQIRVISMETPPLQYFNSSLRLLRSCTPVRSPDWCISQRTESEVKQFQKRRAQAHKKKIKPERVKKNISKTTEGISLVNKDLKKVMEWVAEKDVRSPVTRSKILQYVIPSRKQNEEKEDEDENL